MLLPIPDKGPSPAPVDVRTALCNQSSALYGATLRLRNSGTALAPTGPDGWRGAAEKAQSLVVGHLESMVESTCTTLESARQLTNTAIWSMTVVG